MPNPLRIIFMGTPEFSASVLAHLLGTPHQVVGVYSQPPRPAHRGKKETPSPVHQLAEQHGLPILTPLSLKSEEEQKKFTELKADVALVVAYGLLLPEAILQGTRLGCLNIHTSKLPRWRGAAPIQRAIMAGDAETAVTLMQMDKGLDTGPILLEAPVAISPTMTAGELHDVMKKMAGPLAVKALEALDAGTLSPRPQPVDGASYAAKISKEECRVDWTRAGVDIVNHVRGLNPVPGAFFIHGGARYKLHEAVFESGNVSATPGTIMDEALGIACADGIVRLIQIQPEGKKPMTAEAFLRGHPLPRGERIA